MGERDNILVMGADHGGFEMKEYLKKGLAEKGYEIKDYGTYSEESVDYPDIIHPLSSDINKGKYPNNSPLFIT